ncbi:MAG: hypothetical protein R2708_21650 [Vicinamibacterales bacterium]
MRRGSVIAVVSSLALAVSACGSNPSAPAESGPAPAAAPAVEPEARSVSGRPLVPMALPEAERTRLEANLTAAEEELARNPGSADALIWVGRRQAYLWQYRNAIATFSRGIEAFPDGPALLPPPRPSLHHGA